MRLALLFFDEAAQDVDAGGKGVGWLGAGFVAGLVGAVGWAGAPAADDQPELSGEVGEVAGGGEVDFAIFIGLAVGEVGKAEDGEMEEVAFAAKDPALFAWFGEPATNGGVAVAEDFDEGAQEFAQGSKDVRSPEPGFIDAIREVDVSAAAGGFFVGEGELRGYGFVGHGQPPFFWDLQQRWVVDTVYPAEIRLCKNRGMEQGMEFTIEPAIFERFPGITIAVAVARGIDNAQARPGIAEGWQEAWAGASVAASSGNAQSHPRVRPWREAFQAMGVSGKEFRSSIEALLRRAMKGGEPFSINPLVDWYNTVSLRHVVPAGRV